MKKRVLFLNDTSRNGGPGRTLFYLLKHFDPDKIERVAVVPREGFVTNLLRPVTEDLIVWPALIENLVEPWDRPVVRDDFAAPWQTKSMRATANIARATAGMVRLASWVARNHFDLIFCNGTTACFAGGFLAAVTGVPTIWHVFYTSVPAQIVHERLSAGANVKAILCVSKPTTKLFLHCKSKVHIVGDSIDIDEYNPSIEGIARKELGLAGDAILFGSQGRIIPKKGYFELIDAAEIALAKMTDSERAVAHFLVLGDTPGDMHPDHLAECRQRVIARHLEKNVNFWGSVSDVRPWVKDFDVSVIPSIYEDPLPRAVMESMAMQKPVIAFDVGGMPEMIDDDRNGFLVQGHPPDVSAMADRFLRYLRDPELRRQHGLRARQTVIDRFQSKVHSARIENFILEHAR